MTTSDFERWLDVNGPDSDDEVLELCDVITTGGSGTVYVQNDHAEGVVIKGPHGEFILSSGAQRDDLIKQIERRFCSGMDFQKWHGLRKATGKD